MKQTRGSTSFGPLLTSSMPWSLSVEGERFELTFGARVASGDVVQLEGLTVRPGIVWATVEIKNSSGKALTFECIANGDARKMRDALATSIAIVRIREHVAVLIEEFKSLDCSRSTRTPSLTGVHSIAEIPNRRGGRQRLLRLEFVPLQTVPEACNSAQLALRTTHNGRQL